MLWTMFYFKTLSPGIHVDVSLKCTTYLNIKQVVFSNASGHFFQQDVDLLRAALVALNI